MTKRSPDASGKGASSLLSRRLFLAGCGAIAAAMPFSLPPAGAAEAVIRAARNGHFITNVELEGVRVRAVIDTGASVVAIPHDVAEEVGLEPDSLDYDKVMGTANGQVKAASVTLSEVAVEDVSVADVEAVVMPRGALHVVLIGMSFLNRLESFSVEGKTLYLEG